MIQTAILELILVGGTGLALIAAGLIVRIGTRFRNSKCKYTSIGKVVGHYYKGEMRVGPIVEFTADDGQTYKTQKQFEGIKSVVKYPHGHSDIWEDENGWLHTSRGMVGRWRECAEKLWPIGSEQTVHYDPKNPKRNYVERPVTNNVLTKIFVLTGVGIMVLSIVMFYMIQKG